MARDRQRAKQRKAKRLKQKQQAGGRAERSAQVGINKADERDQEAMDAQALEATTIAEQAEVETVEPETKPAPKQKEKAREGPRGRGRVLTFLGEVRGELKRVQWPDRQALAQGTAVVIAAVLIAGTYLWLFDLIWNEMVKQLL